VKFYAGSAEDQHGQEAHVLGDLSRMDLVRAPTHHVPRALPSAVNVEDGLY